MYSLMDAAARQVTLWARDIRQQVPGITWSEAIRIAEKWNRETRVCVVFDEGVRDKVYPKGDK